MQITGVVDEVVTYIIIYKLQLFSFSKSSFSLSASGPIIKPLFLFVLKG